MPAERRDKPIVGLVINPNAKKNRMAFGRADQMRRVLGELGLVVESRSESDVADAARRFRAERVSYWVADGGDGALNWLIHAWRASGSGDASVAQESPIFVATNGGTIDFVGKKLGLRGEPVEVVRRLVGRIRQGQPIPETRLDSLRVCGWDVCGTLRWDRLGFAAAIAGIGQRFFDQYYAYDGPGPGTIVRVVGRTVAGLAARAMSTPREGGRLARWEGNARELFAPLDATVHINGERLPFLRYTAINVGAFDVNLGGVFRVFPMAGERGRLHIQAGALEPHEVIANLPRLAAGGHVKGRAFVETVGSYLRVDVPEGTHLRPVLDGEFMAEAVSVEATLGPELRFAVP